jgi:hypothetical protein
MIEVIKCEPQSLHIISNLDGYHFTSQLGRIEVIRTFKRFYAPLINDAYTFLAKMNFIAMDQGILDGVEGFDAEVSLSTADAIHVSTALKLLDDGGYLVTFDRQMAINAEKLGIKTISA